MVKKTKNKLWMVIGIIGIIASIRIMISNFKILQIIGLLFVVYYMFVVKENYDKLKEVELIE